MFNPENVSPSSDSKPFLIYIRHRDKQRDVSWRPDAFMGFSRGLHTSGFLAALPAEELKSLLYLLSFVTPNGDVMPSILQLAEAFHLSQGKTHRRLERLMQMNWAKEPLVHYRRFESGLDAFVPQRGLFTVEEESFVMDEQPRAPLYRAASREAIIAHNRRTYARPRAEVEAIVASQLRSVSEPAKPVPQFTAEQQKVVGQLRSLGVNDDQIESLLTRFEVPRIQRQMEWLPYRHAKNPASFLIAAIERGYEAPRGLPSQLAESATTLIAKTPPVANPDDSMLSAPTPLENDSQ